MNAQHRQKLCKVDINSCKSLKTLFPLSIARNLLQLKDLNVKRCDVLEEIVAKEGAEDAAARTFVFPQLTRLTLKDLQELKRFYPVLLPTINSPWIQTSIAFAANHLILIVNAIKEAKVRPSSSCLPAKISAANLEVCQLSPWIQTSIAFAANHLILIVNAIKEAKVRPSSSCLPTKISAANLEVCQPRFVCLHKYLHLR
ncbi:hypothetical protein QYF36_016341 [Acer negundo]|nr:hypothetical protein QYF36_016341 [Acer negundo]